MGNSPAVYTYKTKGKRKDDFKPTLKHREGVYPLDLSWDLFPENRYLVVEGSAFQNSFRDPRNYQ